MQTGKVKWYNNKSKYGFIRRETGTDVFFHKTELKTKVWPGKLVNFDVRDSPKGQIAIDIIDAVNGSSG